MMNKTINGYTIKYQIGTGGMADVYFGENTLGFTAAIKVLKREYSLHPQVKDRFVNEAKIMKTLDHPYIRKVMDLGDIEGNPCIIMEYLEGQTFKEMLQSSNKISDSRLIKYFDQCVDALQYTHSKKVTHRDIKPSNIFITKKDEVKLLDFGIAKSEMGLSHTITGQTLGTIIYMSPEQVVDPKRVTSQTDIYSLGVTFYQALTGKPPYDAKTGSEFTIQQKIVYENLDLTIIPTHWRSKLESCLHKKAEDRSMSMHKTKDYTIFDPPLPPPPPQPSTTSNWFLYFFIGGIVIALAVGLYFVKTETPEWKLQKRIISEIRSNMVKVEGGSFMMGCNEEQGQDCESDEYPVHEEKISSFYISKYEVTQEQYQAIMWNNPSYFKNCDRCPVENVSWDDAQEFIKKLNELSGEKYRLPSSVEWEYAARGGNKSHNYKYSGSNEIGDVAWYDVNSGFKVHEVGGKYSNELGLHDMSGNVWEWCSDHYSEDYNSPRNSQSLEIRSGSFGNLNKYCIVSSRGYQVPSDKSLITGFRLISK